MRLLTELSGMWAGHRVWVLGSGPSLDHVDPALFAGEKVVACNNVAATLPLPATADVISATNYHHGIDAPRGRLVAPFDDVTGRDPDRHPREGCYRFRGGPQHYAAFDAVEHWPDDPDALVVGSGSMSLCLHLAAYLGASAIVLAGADCGEIDGRANFAGYPATPLATYPYALQSRDLAAVAAQVRARYGCGVHSLNPFANLALESHRFAMPGTSLSINSEG